jgi:PhnB protein
MQITQVNPHLHFNGQCETAFKFYEQCFGGKIEYMSAHAGTPVEAHVPPEWRDKILHATLRVGGGILMGCDVPPDHYQQPKGFSVSIQTKDPADAERIFNVLAENGKIGMPLQQTFWSVRFGMLVDRFGIPWMINCEQAP